MSSSLLQLWVVSPINFDWLRRWNSFWPDNERLELFVVTSGKYLLKNIWQFLVNSYLVDTLIGGDNEEDEDEQGEKDGLLL